MKFWAFTIAKQIKECEDKNKVQCPCSIGERHSCWAYWRLKYYIAIDEMQKDWRRLSDIRGRMLTEQTKLTEEKIEKRLKKMVKKWRKDE